jgi:hypothetical protein
MLRTQELSSMAKVVSIITAILLSGSGQFLLVGELAQTKGSEIQPTANTMNVYQCVPYGDGLYRIYRQLSTLDTLPISIKPITNSVSHSINQGGQ